MSVAASAEGNSTAWLKEKARVVIAAHAGQASPVGGYDTAPNDAVTGNIARKPELKEIGNTPCLPR